MTNEEQKKKCPCLCHKETIDFISHDGCEHCLSPQAPKEQWEEEFDSLFQFDGVTYKGQRHWKEGVKENLVKSFIRKVLSEAITAERERIVEGIGNLVYPPNKVTISKILSIVRDEGEKK